MLNLVEIANISSGLRQEIIFNISINLLFFHLVCFVLVLSITALQCVTMFFTTRLATHISACFLSV